MRKFPFIKTRNRKRHPSKSGTHLMQTISLKRSHSSLQLQESFKVFQANVAKTTKQETSIFSQNCFLVLKLVQVGMGPLIQNVGFNGIDSSLYIHTLLFSDLLASCHIVVMKKIFRCPVVDSAHFFMTTNGQRSITKIGKDENFKTGGLSQIFLTL